VVLAGSGHLPQLEAPDAFGELVLAFLSTVP
jgi:pimeloyl-ACP methyl ester carboxylesterase